MNRGVAGFNTDTGRVRVVFHALIARTPEEWEQGLVGVAPEEFRGLAAMVLAFKVPIFPIFTMDGVRMPIDVALISPSLTILEIAHLDVGSRPYYPPHAILFAVELPKGEASRHSLQTGDKFFLLG